ncbi:MAG: GNAT family N-acetyltransferase [Alphaproteobacteria bacterium]|nr:GNAT family N-acetyltransferase [Alphaproteobacteria bacterium]
MLDLIYPLPQSEAFERTCKMLGLPVRRIEDEGTTCLIQMRKVPLIGSINLISRGPVWSSDTPRTDYLNRVREEVKGPLAINAPSGAEAPGFKLLSGAALAILDLMNPNAMRARLHQNWRNQLKKAEQSSLRVINQPIDAQNHKWFFEAERTQQRSRKYRSHPPGFILAYAAANKNQARLYTAMHENEPVAAMLVLKHGLMATYQSGVTTEQGRSLCAHNLILWTIMSDLQKRGIQQLDLGRADLSDGLTRFKVRSGARIEKLPGTYLSFRQPRSGKSESRLRVSSDPTPA